MTEQERARHWREAVVGLSRDELAKLTGYSPSAIYRLETEDRDDTTAWRRYKCVCLAVQIMRSRNPRVDIKDWRWGQS